MPPRVPKFDGTLEEGRQNFLSHDWIEVLNPALNFVPPAWTGFDFPLSENIPEMIPRCSRCRSWVDSNEARWPCGNPKINERTSSR